MMNMKKNIILFAFLFVGVLTGYCQQSAYLFVYFTGNRMSEEAVRMAVSLWIDRYIAMFLHQWPKADKIK